MVLKLMMRDRLDEAIGKAESVNPKARLVSIVGIGLHGDGSIHLGDKKDHVSRWQYAFRDHKDEDEPPQDITVIYIYSGEPLVDENAGNVTHDEPFETEMISNLSNSKRLVDLFNEQPGFKPMAGDINDVIVYFMEKMLAPVALIMNWKGQMLRVDPLTMEIL